MVNLRDRDNLRRKDKRPVPKVSFVWRFDCILSEGGGFRAYNTAKCSQLWKMLTTLRNAHNLQNAHNMDDATCSLTITNQYCRSSWRRNCMYVVQKRTVLVVPAPEYLFLDLSRDLTLHGVGPSLLFILQPSTLSS